MSRTLCPLPWIHISQRNNGHFRACCHTDTQVNRGLLQNSNGQPLHASSATLNEVRNSHGLKDIRKAMLQGEWHKQCGQCHREELSGVRSARQNETERWNERWDVSVALANTSIDGTLDLNKNPLLSADIRLGNVCNLKCRMCGPMDSRAWYADYEKLYRIGHFKDTQGHVVFTDQNKNDPYMWFEDQNFWDQLFTQKQSLRSLYLVGGEPLLIEKHFDFLDRLVFDDVAKNIELIYNTNLTRLTDRTLDLWKHFGRVNVGVSVDGISSANDYIRSPSRFIEVQQNIRKLDQAGENINMWLAPTIQIYNLLNIPDFLRWALQENFRFLQTPTQTGVFLFHLLHNPQFLNIQTLPYSVKLRVQDRYERFFEEWPNLTKKIPPVSQEKTQAYLQSVLHYMNAKDTSSLMEKFVQHTKDLDKIRNETLPEALPELHIMLREDFLSRTHLGQTQP